MMLYPHRVSLKGEYPGLHICIGLKGQDLYADLKWEKGKEEGLSKLMINTEKRWDP